MSWLALAVLSSCAALLAGAVGWSVPATRGRTVARWLFVLLVVLASVFFVLTAGETSAFWQTPPGGVALGMRRPVLEPGQHGRY
jgi:hypothetical protein